MKKKIIKKVADAERMFETHKFTIYDIDRKNAKILIIDPKTGEIFSVPLLKLPKRRAKD